MTTVESAFQGELITQRLAETRMTVSAFARALGVQPSFVHAVKTGTRRLTKPETVEKAAAILGIPADALYVSAGHLPPDAWTIHQRRPGLVQVLRNLDARLDRDVEHVRR